MEILEGAVEAVKDEISLKARRKIGRIWRRYGIIIISVVIFLIIKLFVCELVMVSGNSMNPNLQSGDVLLVWKLGYRVKDGDVIVARRSVADEVVAEKSIVKRVIAVEGETVDIDFEEWKVYVNGE